MFRSRPGLPGGGSCDEVTGARKIAGWSPGTGGISLISWIVRLFGYLLTHSAAGNNIIDSPVTVSASGLKTVYAGAGAAAFTGVPNSDPRHPDIIGIAQHGVVYTGGTAKIAEHGGDDRQDRNVPILVVAPGLREGRTIGAPVETTQIAPTILRLLGLNPGELQAVRIEHTQVLPGLTGRHGEK